RPRARGREVEEEETVENRGCTLIEHRPEVVSRMADEIRERHLARENERHRTSEESEKNQRAAYCFDDTGKPWQRADHGGPTAGHDRRRESEPLGRADLDEEEGDHDPESAQEIRSPGTPA